MYYTDDPDRDFDRWDEAQQERQDKLPRCPRCGEPISEYALETWGMHEDEVD